MICQLFNIQLTNYQYPINTKKQFLHGKHFCKIVHEATEGNLQMDLNHSRDSESRGFNSSSWSKNNVPTEDWEVCSCLGQG